MKAKPFGFKFWWLPALVALMAVLSSLASNGSTSPVQADPGHTGDSLNVAIIGSPGVINGGTFPTSGVGTFDNFVFTNLLPANVTTANLAAFDTVLLNVASTEIGCDLATNLLAAAKTDLVTFVAGGKKLIIYDSECVAQNYSWLPFPFTTQNPGAFGATGTLTIVEENTLSTNAAGPHFIDAADLGANTDAVGDMNVMVTRDPNWCLDMSGTNVSGTTGPVHTYARHGSVGSVGLIIYNGLDVDVINSNANLAKIWLQELEQPTNPDGLPCGFSPVGITISPLAAVNNVGGQHTVTATLTDLLGQPNAGVLVSFSVTAGPNTGQVSNPNTGECTANNNCTTDATGKVSWTYTGTGGVGTDDIIACFTPQGATSQVCSRVAKKEWVQQSDTTKPSCALTKTIKGPPVKVEVTAQDTGSGIATIKVLKATNANVSIPAFTPGTTSPVVVTATKVNQSLSSTIQLEVKDVAGNVTVCDPVIQLVVREAGKPVTHTFTGLPQAESKVEVTNGDPGLTHLVITVNGKKFQLAGLKDNEVRAIDVSSAMVPGNNNTITLEGRGKPGGSALIVISD